MIGLPLCGCVAENTQKWSVWTPDGRRHQLDAGLVCEVRPFLHYRKCSEFLDERRGLKNSPRYLLERLFFSWMLQNSLSIEHGKATAA
jgi:hypothetical protein